MTAGFIGACDGIGWGVAGFFIGGSVLAVSGSAIGSHGRKRIFHWVAAFALPAVFSAGGTVIINLSRVLQAFAGAAILPITCAGAPAVPEWHNSGWAGRLVLGAGVAPGVALILANAGWRVVYLVSAPVALLMFWAGQRLLKELPTPPDQQASLVGAAAGTLAIRAAVTAIMQGRIWGYTSALTALVAAVGVLSFVVFISNSFRHPEPLLTHLLRRRGVMVANLVNFL